MPRRPVTHVREMLENKKNVVQRRKQDHLRPFRDGQGVPGQGSTWLEYVRLIHRALPELSLDEIDTTIDFAGHRFAVPFFVTGMTGGAREARDINRDIARVADRMGVGFGLGSQRAMLEDPRLCDTYEVRDVAPGVFLAGNIGGTQLVRTSLDRIRAMLKQVQADALCVHLNPAQEMLQREGDRDFGGICSAIEATVRDLGLPVIVKEVGAGISREVAMRLREIGVRHVDVAGAGGTSWVGVELLRSGETDDLEKGAFLDWGIPTAAALSDIEDAGFDLVASGGIRTGLDAARAIALGASLVGVASPLIQAWFREGEGGVERVLRGMVEGLKTAMVLTGARCIAELKAVPRVITGPLLEWRCQRGCTQGSMR